jgi:2-haloacid dehalogenase
MDRWVTFDCYGTLIDWERGIADTLTRLWPSRDRDELLAKYHDLEPEIQKGEALPYREVMAEVLQRIARDEGVTLSPGDEDALATSLPGWDPFPEVPASLRELVSLGWRLAILSNTDPDLLAASIERIGVRPDRTITAAEARSYKPAHGHWEVFRQRSGAPPDRHVHVAASLFHDIIPCSELGIPAVWINRTGEITNYPRTAELPDLSDLPVTLDAVIPHG